MILRFFLRFSIVLFLLFPFLFLLVEFRLQESLDWAEIIWALKNTFNQAFLSALFSSVLGLWLALSLIKIRQTQVRKTLDIICLVPNLLPTIFVLLATLKSFNYFPMGTTGIVIIHAIINVGLVGTLLAQILESHYGRMAFVAYASGASKLRFYGRVLLPTIWRQLSQVFLFVFVMCFGSFSVPLVVGGGRGTTLEVLIYEKIRLSQEWGAAVYISIIQSIFIFILSLLLYRNSRKSALGERYNISYYGSYSGLLVVAALLYVFVWGYGGGVLDGLQHFQFIIDNRHEIFQLAGGTLWVGLTVGFLTAFLLLSIVYLSHARWFTTFLNGYVTPSTALAGFSMLGIINFLKLDKSIGVPIVIVLLGVCGLFRLGLYQLLQDLRSQTRIAYILGAKPWQIFSRILLPQTMREVGKLAALAAMWACGDFAVSRIIATKTFTLAMMTDALMSGYRLNHAVLISLIVILCAVLVFAFIQGVFNVIGKKLDRKI